jgi:peptide/nickel transport system substrate-binding protein
VIFFNPISSYRSLSPAQRRILPRLLSRFERALLILFIVAFAGSGLYLAIRLTGHYSVAVPASGGLFREGVIGIPRFINPLLASSEADRDLTALVYSGLLRNNGAGALEPSLAERYEISEDGRAYTFYLREDARWSDGKPLTADDVLFTLSLVKDPNYRSVLRANWEGVTAEKIDERAILFTLAKPYAPFLDNVTVGILPRHIWNDVRAAEFPLSKNNLRPIGAGPYRARSFEQNAAGRILSYTLEANPHYVPHEPHIKTIELYFYTSASELKAAKDKGILDAASVPLVSDYSVSEADVALPLPRIFGVFYNQNASDILADKAIRTALLYATDRSTLVESVLHNQGTPVFGPLPMKPADMHAEEQNPLHTLFDTATSSALLARAGWEDIDEDGVREKKIGDEQVRLSFTLSTSDAPDLIETARLLQDMWKRVGIDVTLAIYEIGDFEQDVLRPRKYDAVLFGEVFGFDPDPFAFWHSSQRNDPGLNIAMYTNARADTLLEHARTTIDPTDRWQAYQEFQAIIVEEQPALFLYSPDYIYAPAASVKNMDITDIIVPADRFGSIHNWYIQTKKQWKGFNFK